MTTTVTAADNAPKVLINQSGRKGDPGTNGTNGDGFNQVRKSLIDNPLCHLFKTNKLVETSAPTNTDADVTFTRATTGTYVDRYGVVRTSAINEPREEKDGFLIEGTSTNNFSYSEQFDNGMWLKLGSVSVTANATTAPDGVLTADEINTTAAAGGNRIQYNFPTYTVGLKTFSIFLKAGTETRFRLRSGEASSVKIIIFDTTTETFTILTAPYSYGFEKLSNDWYRVYITVNVLGTASTLISSVGVPDFSSGTIYAWGAQFEDLGFASSYIPTVSTAVTRLSDGASVVGFNNATRLDDAFSISATYNAFGFQAFNRLFTFGTSSFNADSAYALYDSGGNIFYSNGTDTNKFGQNAGFTSIDFALTYDNQIGNMYVNGVGDNDNPLTLTGASTVVPNKLVIGGSYSGFNPLFGHVKDFRFYDFALNANEVEYLSQ